MNEILNGDVLNAIEAILRSGGIAEVKEEKAGIVVVDVSRKVKYRPEKK